MSKLDRYLFRGQRPDNGQFVYGNLILNKSDEKLVNVYIENTDINEFRQWEVIPETVGQFTGLTDKNGVKIFEGDVVYMDYSATYEKYNRLIEWRGTGFYTYRKTGKSTVFELLPLNIGNDCDAEVIGNIHDNPELL